MSVISIDRDGQRSELAQDVPAEQALLGACMVSPEVAPPIVLELLDVQHWYRPAHQKIYRVLVELFDSGSPTDIITMINELDRRAELESVGGRIYLTTLLQSAPVVSEGSLAKWAESVRDKAASRKVGEVGAAFAALAELQTSTNAEIAAMLDRAQEAVAEAAEWIGTNPGDDDTVLGGHLSRVLTSIHDRATNGVSPGVQSGFAELDALTNGFYPGQLVVVGGRPGIGKTTLAVDFARTAAIRDQVPTLMLSMEMSTDEVTERVLAAEAGIRLGDLRRGTLVRDDFDRMTRRIPDLQDAPLHILDVAGATITELRAQARKMTRKHGIKMIVIDYLQLIESQGKAENRQIEVAGFSRKLKLLAKELDVPVVVAAQLNRGPEQRQDKIPQLADFRESGGIENDADLVVMVHRPDAYDREDPRMGEADLIVPKHRAGPTATISIAHQLHYSRFVDMDVDAAAPPARVGAAGGSVSLCPGCHDPVKNDQPRRGAWHADCAAEVEAVDPELGLGD